MRTITLDDRATPESAEAALWQATQGTHRIVVHVHGFPMTDLAVIAARLDGWTAHRDSATVVSLTRNVAGTVEAVATTAGRTARQSGRRARVPNLTANVMSNPLMSPERAGHDIHAAARAAKGGVIGWQEVQPYLTIIRHLVGFDTYSHPGLGNIAISWDSSRFDLVDAGGQIVTQGHGGDVPTPNRGYAWVRLRDKATGREFTRVNSHLINKAWNGREDNPGQLAYRRFTWTSEAAALNRFLSHVAGPWVAGGDFNAPRNLVGHALPGQVDTHDGIDHLAHGGQAKAAGRLLTWARGLFTDHPFVTQTYTV